ncbi:Glycosyltransferase involved in cell wall bisynthesis [Thermoanaerobacterium sp. RBIITD]|nr:Glycosyltransferase involved in cell wall bisynthesis [Thermoanaerobacterium sp. RBIITD]
MVDILLSTYNGEKYIKEQIESILNQTYTNWRLLIRDDGSCDRTLDIIEEYVKKLNGKIYFINDSDKHLGASMSFFKLLNYSTADYIMFCDQDDVWIPDKIEITIGKMKDLEKLYPDKPILVHSNLKVVDVGSKTINESFWKYQKLNPNLKRLNNLLIQNNVTGCTVMINRKLKNLLKTVPSNAIMHDWWLALIASAFGIVEYIDEPLILYRQHGGNDTGAKKYGISYFINKTLNYDEAVKTINKIINQGKEFYSIYENMLAKEQKDIIYNFITLFEVGRLKRIYRIFKYKFFKYGFLRNFGFIIVMLIPGKTKEKVIADESFSNNSNSKLRKDD